MNKYQRQMRMQQTAVGVLRRDPSLLNDPRLLDRLDTISEHTFGEPYRQCIERWRSLLQRGDLDTLSHMVLEDSEYGGYLRTVSPLGMLLTGEQRRAVVYGNALVAA
ncbi:hypothetical protein [Mycolicibacterium fallax]|nr:hypothetical protein [Mycolicibacterium fallax]